MSFTKLLVRRCTIQRPTVSENELGEQTFVFVTIASNVLCDIQNDSGTEVRRTVGEFIEGNFRGYFLSTQDVKEKDKIIDDRSVEYAVRFVNPIFQRQGSGIHHLEAELFKPHLLEEV